MARVPRSAFGILLLPLRLWSNGEIHLRALGKAQIQSSYGDKDMFVFFHRMQKAPGGCQNDWCDMWTLYLLMGLIAFSNARDDQTYWAYVPDPPILHPAVWDGPEVPVYVNDTHALGLPSDGH